MHDEGDGMGRGRLVVDRFGDRFGLVLESMMVCMVCAEYVLCGIWQLVLQ